MRFLIDCAAFSSSDQVQESSFWRRILPLLPAQLESHELYFLTRGGEVPLEGIPPERRLNAPPPEWGAHRVEERRLFRLCSNLKGDAFLSTSYTSAGSKVPSVFVLTRSYPFLEQRDLPTLLARDGAIRCASLCVALDDVGAQYLSSAFSLPGQRVRIAAGADNSAIAGHVAEALLAAGQAAAPAEPPPRKPWILTNEQLSGQFNTPALQNVYGQLVSNPALAPQLDALNAVAWHCLNHRPQTYVEFGMRDVLLASLAAQLAPGIELYGSTTSPQQPMANNPAPTFDTASQLASLPLKSVGRYTVCSPAELLGDLATAAASPLQVDLAVIRPDPSPYDAVAQVNAVREHLGERAALVIIGANAADVAVMSNLIRERYAEFAYFPMRQGNTVLAPLSSSVA
jgi:hypothetical protein